MLYKLDNSSRPIIFGKMKLIFVALIVLVSTWQILTEDVVKPLGVSEPKHMPQPPQVIEVIPEEEKCSGVWCSIKKVWHKTIGKRSLFHHCGSIPKGSYLDKCELPLP
ncbi:uncharacterized protein LOC129771081 isoform X2 [Toxorhynchites rutilus septentrionalis]|uniref:uncharacterized protein LOC129771081 isoform X2 n=1 Tax=Toxorhynchites rutilus septentrionalis TaxID=329112 RepID=UPI00247977B3|nr:uncharacterized protein LOC129771081 isoform X2 [Toxorhynchites rutilus septentrionalis]